MKNDPINSRILLLMLSFVQTVVIYCAIFTLWLPGSLSIDEIMGGKPLPSITAWLFHFSKSLQGARLFRHEIALAVSGLHLFFAFALIWSSRERKKFQFRWNLFTTGVWAILFFWAFFVFLSMTHPFVTALQGMVIPPTTFFTAERFANLALILWFILLAVAAIVIYKKDRRREESGAEPS